MKDQILIIGLVVSLGVGYLIGHFSAPRDMVVATQNYPQNYDPARGIANDAIKAAQESQANCWSQLTAILIEKKSPEVSH